MKKQYFLSIDVELDGSEKAQRFLQDQIVSEDIAKRDGNGFYLELVFDDSGKLVDAANYDLELIKAIEEEGEDDFDEAIYRWMYEDAVAEGSMRYVDYPVNNVYEFVPDAEGIHCLGGEPSASLVMPSTSPGFPVQYLGCLNSEDTAFSSLIEFDFHLMCPIFCSFREFWVDYSNPTSPLVFDEVGMTTESAIVPLTPETHIVFEKIAFNTKPWPIDSHGGHTGLATWIQEPDIPVCPKTGDLMKPLCVLGTDMRSDRDIVPVIPKIATHNVQNLEEDDYLYRTYLNKMTFCGGGYLYVYYCPNSKLARYTTQST